MVIWITGLSGAGKTTLARAVAQRVRATGGSPVVVDGDEVRKIVDDPGTKHDPAGRLTNALRVSRLAHYLESEGLAVIVATMSLFHEIHARNRDHFEAYFEVLIEASDQTRKKRDPKGIYARAEAGMERGLPGIDIGYELPTHPDLVISNDAKLEELLEYADFLAEQFSR